MLCNDHDPIIMSAYVFGIKRENPTSPVCRGCLTEWGIMRNMYDTGLFMDFFKYTDISRESSEDLPVMLCSNCEDDLNKTKDFMERCRKSDRILKDNIKMKSKNDQSSKKSQVSTFLNDNKLILKITAPDPEDKIYLPCPFSDCSDLFIKKSLLSNHLKNIHRLSAHIDIEQQYFCTVEGCTYNLLNSVPKKFFTGRKFLNQHYNKCHKEKIYLCVKCNMIFPLLTDLYRHTQACKLLFPCPICKAVYKRNESFLVHLKRRHPDVHAKYKEEKTAKRLCNLEESNPGNSSKKIKSFVNNGEQTTKVKESVEVLWQESEYNVTSPLVDNMENVEKNTNISKTAKQIFEMKEALNEDVFSEQFVIKKTNKTSDKDLSEEVITEDSGITTNVHEDILNEMMDRESIIPSFAEEYALQKCDDDATVGLKRTYATQIPSEETLNSWTNKTDFEMQTDAISTGTVLDELLSMKPQNSEDDGFLSESVTDIETQTFPFEFPLNKCNKETQFSTSLYSSFKETQTCVCFCELSTSNCRNINCPSSNQNCFNVISTETQTGDNRKYIHSDVMLSFSSIETQTCFDDSNDVM